MKQLSLLDKFQIFFDNMLQHPLFIIILLVPIIIWLLQKKHGKKAFIIVYSIVILFVLIIGGDLIFKLFDNLMDGLFMVLYFPNFITLFIVVVACSLIALISFFSKKMYKINKIINITSFALVQLLFVLILTIVKAKSINIYKDNALYVNNDVLTLMQLLIGTFTLQIISILIINGINKVTDILNGRNKEIENEIKTLEKNKKTAKIKTIEIDNSKYGYINIADKSKTSIPKLKPFKFDVDKLESIKLNAKDNIFDSSSISSQKIIENNPIKKDETLNNIYASSLLETNNKTIFDSKPIEINDHKEIKEINPKEKLHKKDETLNNIYASSLLETNNKTIFDSKPIEINVHKEIKEINPKEKLHKKDETLNNIYASSLLKANNKTIFESKPIESNVAKQINPKENIKPIVISSTELVNALKNKKTPSLQIKTFVKKPTLIKTNLKTYEENIIDNLDIIDIQSTLDVVAKFKLEKIKLHSNKAEAIDNLQIPNFDLMLSTLIKCKLYKN